MVCVRFSLPSGSFFRWFRDSLWCFVMQRRGETGTRSKQAGSALRLGISFSKHQKYLFLSFPVIKICCLCSTEAEFYWDLSLGSFCFVCFKSMQCFLPKRVKGTKDSHSPPLIYSTSLQGCYKLEFSLVHFFFPYFFFFYLNWSVFLSFRSFKWFAKKQENAVEIIWV